MALQSFANRDGIILAPFWNDVFGTYSNSTMDAAGESNTFIGRCKLTTGIGTSKTISSAGGKIHFRVGGTATFANAGTTIRVGVQDVSAGLEDGTFDVHDDLVGGTDTLTVNAVNTATMSSGTKTITHGDLIAVSIEMTARGGADTVQISRRAGNGYLFPYCTADTGSGPARTSNQPCVTIEFDDGTMGWLGMDSFVSAIATPSTFGSTSSPDEHALIFKLPEKAVVVGAILPMTNVAVTDDFEVILYSTPLGTPTAELTLAVDADETSATNTTLFAAHFATTYELAANTDYAIALRPTTANAMSYYRSSFGNANLRKPTILGTNWRLGTRTDQSGAFSEDTTILPGFMLILGEFDDGAGGGGTTVFTARPNAHLRR